MGAISTIRDRVVSAIQTTLDAEAFSLNDWTVEAAYVPEKEVNNFPEAGICYVIGRRTAYQGAELCKRDTSTSSFPEANK